MTLDEMARGLYAAHAKTIWGVEPRALSKKERETIWPAPSAPVAWEQLSPKARWGWYEVARWALEALAKEKVA